MLLHGVHIRRKLHREQCRRLEFSGNYVHISLCLYVEAYQYGVGERFYLLHHRGIRHHQHQHYRLAAHRLAGLLKQRQVAAVGRVG